jgi:hypothetical protein
MKEGTMTTDPFDVDLQDAELSAEIQLVADLIVAASQAPGTLPQEVVDAVLGHGG